MTNQEFKELSKQANKLEVGMIVYASWGWEQTNIDWYKVVKRTDKRIHLQTLKEVRVASGDMSGKTLPSEEIDETCPIIVAVANAAYMKICANGYNKYLHVWDGRAKNFTAYA